MSTQSFKPNGADPARPAASKRRMPAFPPTKAWALKWDGAALSSGRSKAGPPDNRKRAAS